MKIVWISIKKYLIWIIFGLDVNSFGHKTDKSIHCLQEKVIVTCKGTQNDKNWGAERVLCPS